jgi:hypothetical protein
MNRLLTSINKQITKQPNKPSHPTNHITPLPAGEGSGERLLLIMKQLVKNIRCLAGVEYEPKPRLKGKEMGRFCAIDNAWLLVEDGRFAEFGSVADGMPEFADIDQTIDAEGGIVMPYIALS